MAEESYEDGSNERYWRDDNKIFVTRIPSTFDSDIIKTVLENTLGKDSVVEVALVKPKESDQDEKEEAKEKKTNKNEDPVQHRGFAFVTLSTREKQNEALELVTIRGKVKETSKRKHTLYIRPVQRHGDADQNTNEETGGDGGVDNICYLWMKFRCPYGENCKFLHEGDGGCLDTSSTTTNKKKQKCFSFRKRGKCKLGENCPFLHELKENTAICMPTAGNEEAQTNSDKQQTIGEESVVLSKDKKDKDCISWKTKGKCRKKDTCPYRHDESVREKALAKKQKNKETAGKTNEDRKRKIEDGTKVKQPLSIRVFGLNYDTTKEDVRAFFEKCGVIKEITFPTFEDSGRSKGYCGILFTSPKATEKACAELNGAELQGKIDETKKRFHPRRSYVKHLHYYFMIYSLFVPILYTYEKKVVG